MRRRWLAKVFQVALILSLSGPLLVGFPKEAHGQGVECPEALHLRDGSIYRGVIVERRPDEAYLLRTADGSLILIAYDEVTRIVREECVPQRPMTGGGFSATSPKSPGLAWGLSFLITGAGQVYNEEIGKGLAMFAGASVLPVVGFASGDEAVAGITLLAALGIWVWSQVDAYGTAQSINRQGGFAWGSASGVSIEPLTPVRTTIASATNRSASSRGPANQAVPLFTLSVRF